MENDILKPRYKVVSDYPFAKHCIGDILTRIPKATDNVFAKEGWKPGDPSIDESYLMQYPHLFRKLEWWEERQIEDLPLFVRFGQWDKPHMIYKIKEWNPVGVLEGNHGLEPFGLAEIPHEYFISLRFPNNFPATKEEYEQQLAYTPK